MKYQILKTLFKIDHKKRIFYKLIKSGNYVEVISYTKGIVLNNNPTTKKTPKIPEKEIISGKTLRHLEYIKRRKQRTVEKILKLMESNFNKKSVFVTLTFGTNDFDTTDIDITNDKLHLFFVKLRKYYPNIKYICVPEFQDNMRVHYHMVFNNSFIPIHLLRYLWFYGAVYIERVYDERGMAYYFTKYLTKNNDTLQLQKKRGFMTSHNLIKPKVVYGDKAELIFHTLTKSNLKPIYLKSYYNEYTDIVLRYKYLYKLDERLL